MNRARDKQVYDLTPDDIEKEPVWYFPMDETVEDEATARPATDGIVVPTSLQVIVRARFFDALERVHVGYVYVDVEQGVASSRPVAWVRSTCITFWNGMSEPAHAYVERVRAVLPPDAWPIAYEGEVTERFPRMAGRLDGLYFIQRTKVVCRTI